MIDVNIKGVFYGIVVVFLFMRERKEGYIINVFLIVGYLVFFVSLVYSGIKFVVWVIIEGFCIEEYSNNICIIIILSGIIDIELLDIILDEELKFVFVEVNKKV